ncbi:hypothetical protein [Microbulbifer epialgicus]|uniref:Uncharacterized protein n=1 Tax=Microbulbifer epialgicus TaxID=393907 RepID=A0ABV4P8R1_9GAMM
MNIENLYRNSASHPDWEGSFTERLREYGEWNSNEFWKLHKELTELAGEFSSAESIPKVVAANIVSLQKSVCTSFAAHFNENDVFSIKDISDEQLHEYMERFDMVILGVFTGQVLPESSFDAVNPLLENN